MSSSGDSQTYDDWRAHLRGYNLAEAIEFALEHDKSVGEAVAELQEPRVETPGDARAVIAALKDQLGDRSFPESGGFTLWSDLHRLIALFGRVYDEEAARLLHGRGLATLVDLYDQRIRWATERASRPENRVASELLAILEQFALWGDTGAATRIVDAARRPLAPDSFKWPKIFEAIEGPNPVGPYLLDALRDPLPAEGTLLEAAYLSFANRRAKTHRDKTHRDRNSELDAHPFDTEAGHARLEALLADPDWDRSDRAETAARALAWVHADALPALFETGINHPVAAVRLACAGWVAREGPEEDAIDAAEALVEMSTHPQTALPARRHLRAMGLEDLVPERADHPEVQAMARMCDWLADDGQYGRPPDDVEIADHRTIKWPPTRDTRPLWLVRWAYRDHDEIDEGIGLVGSGMPFVLYEEIDTSTPPESIYALHCVWELQIVEDPRAPEERTVENGLALLGWN